MPTLGAFLIMNRFQPLVSASAAGIIYCFEPVFAVIFAAFLPVVLLGDPEAYSNEKITSALVLGGLLITAANLMVQGNDKKKAEKMEEKAALDLQN